MCACNSARPLYLEPNMKGCVFYVLHGFALKLGEISKKDIFSIYCMSGQLTGLEHVLGKECCQTQNSISP